MKTFVVVYSGSGSNEAQAWADILSRMYVCWAERHGIHAQPVLLSWSEHHEDFARGVRIDGDVYERLVGERGIHRLTRKSPCDPQGRRHTSFALVDVLTEAQLIDGRLVTAPSWPEEDPPPDVRFYILDPYSVAVDARTRHSREDVQAVLDGDVDSFLDLWRQQEELRIKLAEVS